MVPPVLTAPDGHQPHLSEQAGEGPYPGLGIIAKLAAGDGGRGGVVEGAEQWVPNHLEPCINTQDTPCIWEALCVISFSGAPWLASSIRTIFARVV
jgi:hypothetical protein